MKRLVILMLTALLILAGCGNTALETYLEETADITARFDDAISVANNTPRMQLSGVIRDMQAIQREAEALNTPEEAQENKEYLLEWMDYTIAGFLVFMGQEEELKIELAFATAKGGLNRYVQTRAKLEDQIR